MVSLGFTSKEHQDNYERNVRESIWEGTIRDAIPRLESLAEQIHRSHPACLGGAKECPEYGCAAIRRMVNDFRRTMGPGE